jgi:aminopeptidase-like protein
VRRDVTKAQVAAAIPAKAELARQLMSLVEGLYPICRSITGEGVRSTLGAVSRLIPLTVSEVPSGTPVLDWTVPPEWNIREAYIADTSGRRVVDFADCNLHVVSYSTPINATMSLDELRPHLYSLPEQPDLIPYRTAYYREGWGFCLSHRHLERMEPGEYRVRIDSRLEAGSLTYGELIVAGRTADEVLLSAHICHPSLADDNLSGVAVLATLARRLLDGAGQRHTIRFVFAPGTIGAITWLARNRDRTSSIKHGMTVTCLGDGHAFTYKRTVDGTRTIDRAARAALAASGLEHSVVDFFPYGYDERQYNSPGFRLPIGSLMRGRHGEFPEYHTSADNLTFVSGERMVESLEVLATILDILDRNRVMRSLQPYGEPQLGRRGLYRAIGGTDLPDLELAMLWVLNLSDGEHDLLQIVERSGLDFSTLATAVDALEEHGLLEEVT